MPTIKELTELASKMAMEVEPTGRGPRKWAVHSLSSDELDGQCLLLGVLRSSKKTSHLKLSDITGSIDCAIFQEDVSTETFPGHDCQMCPFPGAGQPGDDTFTNHDSQNAVSQEDTVLASHSGAESTLGAGRSPSTSTKPDPGLSPSTSPTPEPGSSPFPLEPPRDPLRFHCPLPQSWHMGCIVHVEKFSVISEIYSRDDGGSTPAERTVLQYLLLDMRNVTCLAKVPMETRTIGNQITFEPPGMRLGAPQRSVSPQVVNTSTGVSAGQLPERERTAGLLEAGDAQENILAGSISIARRRRSEQELLACIDSKTETPVDSSSRNETPATSSSRTEAPATSTFRAGNPVTKTSRGRLSDEEEPMGSPQSVDSDSSCDSDIPLDQLRLVTHLLLYPPEKKRKMADVISSVKVKASPQARSAAGPSELQTKPEEPTCSKWLSKSRRKSTDEQQTCRMRKSVLKTANSSTAGLMESREKDLDLNLAGPGSVAMDTDGGDSRAGGCGVPGDHTDTQAPQAGVGSRGQDGRAEPMESYQENNDRDLRARPQDEGSGAKSMETGPVHSVPPPSVPPSSVPSSSVPPCVSQLILLIHKDMPQVRYRGFRGSAGTQLSYHLRCVYVGTSQLIHMDKPQATLPQSVLPPGGQMVPPGGQSVLPPEGQKVLPPGGQKLLPPGGQNVLPPGGQSVLPPGGQKVLPPGGQKVLPPGSGSLTQVMIGLSGANTALYELLHPGCVYRLVVHACQDLAVFQPPRVPGAAPRPNCVLSVTLERPLEVVRVTRGGADTTHSTAEKLHFLSATEAELIEEARPVVLSQTRQPQGIQQAIQALRRGRSGRQCPAPLVGRVAFKDCLESDQKFTSDRLPAVSKENTALGVSVPYGSQLLLKLSDPEFGEDLGVYMKLEGVSFPLGLLPGAMAVLHGVEMKESMKGNIYGSFTKASSIRVLGKQGRAHGNRSTLDQQESNKALTSATGQRETKPGQKPHQINNKWKGGIGLMNSVPRNSDVSLKSLRSLWFCGKPAVFRHTCHMTKVVELSLTNQCPGCRQDVRGELCTSKRCPPNTGTRVLWNISFLVEDSTGQAFTESSMRSHVAFLLSLSVTQADALEDLARRSGVVSYHHKADNFSPSAPVSYFLRVLCTSELVRRPILLTAKKYRSFFNNRGEKVQDISEMALDDFPEWETRLEEGSVTCRTFPWHKLECIDVAHIDPAHLVINLQKAMKDVHIK